MSATSTGLPHAHRCDHCDSSLIVRILFVAATRLCLCARSVADRGRGRIRLPLLEDRRGFQGQTSGRRDSRPPTANTGNPASTKQHNRGTHSHRHLISRYRRTDRQRGVGERRGNGYEDSHRDPERHRHYGERQTNHQPTIFFSTIIDNYLEPAAFDPQSSEQAGIKQWERDSTQPKERPATATRAISSIDALVVHDEEL